MPKLTATLTYDGIPIESMERVKPALGTDHHYGGYFRFEYVGGGTDTAYGDELHILGTKP